MSSVFRSGNSPRGTRWQINVYMGWGGVVHNNLAGRSQNNNEKGCCQITVRIGGTIKIKINKYYSVPVIDGK